MSDAGLAGLLAGGGLALTSRRGRVVTSPLSSGVIGVLTVDVLRR